MRWQRVTVVGCGLIGASFALALRQSGICERIAGWDLSASVLDEALQRGVIDEIDGAFSGDTISTSDLIYLAMPVGEIITFLQERSWQFKDGAVITDAGSTKAEVCRAARKHLPEGRWFIGGHPVAGSHLGGIPHARASMFENAPYVLITDDTEQKGQVLASVKKTVEMLGARVVLMTAAEHDRALALVSHLPQLLSSALAATVEAQPDASACLNLAGTGYRDMTRLAASSWSVWRDILATNSESIADALDLYVEKLVELRNELRQCAPCSSTSLASAGALFKR